MTFLELLVSFHEEYGFSGDTPTSVVNQTGERKRMVNWLVNAYKEIQNTHNNWKWLRVGFAVNTVSDDDSYTYGDCTDSLTSASITRFSRWRFDDPIDPAKIYLVSSGISTQTWMVYTSWDYFKAVYRIGTQNSSYPINITVDPQNKLVIGPKPNGVYTITGDYQRSAQVLAANADVPEMPVDYHMLIVHQAARKYAYYESAQEVLLRANEESRILMDQLETDQLPEFRMAGPLA